MKGNDMTDQGENIQPQDEQESKPAGKITNALWFCLGFGAICLLVLIPMMFVCVAPSREPARDAVCLTKLKGIGVATSLYMGGNREIFPPDLFALVESKQPTNMFLCPTNRDPNVDMSDRSSFEQYCAYVYLAGFDSKAPHKRLIAFDLPASHGQKFVNYLRVDGSVRRYDAWQLYTEVQLSNDYLAGKRRAEQ